MPGICKLTSTLVEVHADAADGVQLHCALRNLSQEAQCQWPFATLSASADRDVAANGILLHRPRKALGLHQEVTIRLNTSPLQETGRAGIAYPKTQA